MLNLRSVAQMIRRIHEDTDGELTFKQVMTSNGPYWKFFIGAEHVADIRADQIMPVLCTFTHLSQSLKHLHTPDDIEKGGANG